MFGLWMTLVLGLFILIGAGIVFLTKNNEKFITFSLSLALGVIVMIILTDLIPETIEIFDEKWYLLLAVVACGFLLFRVFDLFIPDHEDDGHSKKEHQDNLIHIGLVSSVALIFHNIIEGMAMYSTFQSSLSLGLMVSIGVGLHNIPLGMVIASAFYQKNQKKSKTLFIVLLLSLSTFIGGLLLFLLGEKILDGLFLGILLALTLGMLLYLCTMELLPRILHSKYRKLSIIGVLVGVLLLSITLFL